MIFLFFSFLLVVAAEKPWGHFMLRVLPLKSKCHCWWLHKRTGENVKVHCISWFLFLAVNPVTFIMLFRLSFFFLSHFFPCIQTTFRIFLRWLKYFFGVTGLLNCCCLRLCCGTSRLTSRAYRVPSPAGHIPQTIKTHL